MHRKQEQQVIHVKYIKIYFTFQTETTKIRFMKKLRTGYIYHKQYLARSHIFNAFHTRKEKPYYTSRFVRDPKKYFNLRN